MISGTDASRGDRMADLGLWCACLLVALSVHLGLAYLLLDRPMREGRAPAEIDPILVDLTPPGASAGEAGPAPPAGEPEAATADPPQDPEPSMSGSEPAASEPPPTEAAAARPDAAPQQEAAAPPDAAPPSVTAEPMPPPTVPPASRPHRAPPLDIKPPAQRRAARIDRKPEPLVRRPPERSAPFPAASRGVRDGTAQTARGASGPRGVGDSGASGNSAASAASWRARIQAYLQSRFRAPAGGGSAAVRVSFTVLRSGQVAGARLASGSGQPALDAAALAAFGGGVPPPPPDVPGSSFPFNIRFVAR